ncbi:hypothetical protein BDV59DRAFT_174497, partial [Aspergillus ambiguus]|uniref:uncharacterized protein n=1 Tax=Aspergillus ambiguus TaxID=176160 RepID=UPI003CCD2AF4
MISLPLIFAVGLSTDQHPLTVPVDWSLGLCVDFFWSSSFPFGRISAPKRGYCDWGLSLVLISGEEHQVRDPPLSAVFSSVSSLELRGKGI